MSLVFTFLRTKSGVVDDPDPNATPPTAADVLIIPQRRHSFAGRDPTRGYIYYLVFKDAGGLEVPTGNANVTLWLKDAKLTNSWAAMAIEKKVPHRAAYTNLQSWVNDADVFFQLTAITGVGVASVEIHAEAV